MGATAVRTKTAKHSLPDPWGLGGISHAPVQAKLRPVCRTGKEGCRTYKTTCQPRFHPKFSPYREIGSSSVYPPRHFQTDEKPQDNLLKIHNSEKKTSDKDWVKNEGENADQCLPLRLTRVHSSRAWRGCCHPAIPVLEELVSQHGPRSPPGPNTMPTPSVRVLPQTQTGSRCSSELLLKEGKPDLAKFPETDKGKKA